MRRTSEQVQRDAVCKAGVAQSREHVGGAIVVLACVLLDFGGPRPRMDVLEECVRRGLAPGWWHQAVAHLLVRGMLIEGAGDTWAPGPGLGDKVTP
jgi:hypothetical protein